MEKKVTWKELGDAKDELVKMSIRFSEIANDLELTYPPDDIVKWLGYCWAEKMTTHAEALITWIERFRWPTGLYLATDQAALEGLAKKHCTTKQEKVFIDQATGKKYRVIEEEE